MGDNKCCNSENTNSKNAVVKIKPKTRAVDKSSCLPNPTEKKSCCCGGGNQGTNEPISKYDRKDNWISGELQTPMGSVPKVLTQLAFSDRVGGWKARWGINRMNYKINPGLYAVGTPDNTSPVLVTANYKLTFDALRKELDGLNAWIMVLDTRGINVWCAAGKGTFGTKEIVSRINKTKLHGIVSHRTLILPQLGAPGVSAHEVSQQTGFKVVYGPVRASDIKEFIGSGMEATPKMRTVEFTVYDRLVLTPMELVSTLKICLMVLGGLFILNLIAVRPFGVVDLYAFVGAILVGTVLTPVLLPWIPGSAFAWKGWLLGFIWVITVGILNGWPISPSFSLLRFFGYLLILPAIASFYAMNFTGSSTYTSLSGVLKEMRIAVPIILITISSGVLLILADSFIKLGGVL